METQVTLIGLVILLLIVGVALYLINLVPIDATIKRIIHVIVILVVVLYLLSVFGFLPHGSIPLK